ncbi:hypothetical protein GPALN_006650 [Globodera pallida]|nr:hypothetical protein GPALN_006650 [Globodera pallida]
MKLIISCFAFLFFAVSLSFASGGDSSKGRIVRGRNAEGKPVRELVVTEPMNEHKLFCGGFRKKAACKKAKKEELRCQWIGGKCYADLTPEIAY